MKRSTGRRTAAALLTLVVAGCSFPASTTRSQEPGVSKAAEAALAQAKGKIYSKGPNGEEPSSPDVATLTPAEVTKVKAKKASAAIVMHYAGNDWAIAQIDGLKTEFARLGIKVVAVTDANFQPDKQVSNIETVMTKKPNIMVSIPTDPVATAQAYKAAAKAGARIVFMDLSPKGMTAGKDYVSVVSADNYGNGVVSAHLLAKALGGKGKIGLIYHEADFFVTRQRYEGFRTTIATEYPDIAIAEEKGIAGPDFAGDAQNVASAMLSKHGDLTGIWAVWDVPAEGVMAAARAYGRLDLNIATEDLGKIVAIALARDQLVVGLGAQVPFDQGVTEARLAAKALLGEKVPPYVALSALPVTHENVLQAWKQVYHQAPPAFLTESYRNEKR
jgi:ribose transport system substrate-binding protein